MSDAKSGKNIDNIPSADIALGFRDDFPIFATESTDNSTSPTASNSFGRFFSPGLFPAPSFSRHTPALR